MVDVSRQSKSKHYKTSIYFEKNYELFDNRFQDTGSFLSFYRYEKQIKQKDL